MSALAKVFVVFIFLLSVAFFGTTATLFKTRTDWRAAYARLDESTKKGLEDLRKRNEEVHKQNETLDKAISGLKASGDELGKTLKQVNEDLAEEKKKVNLQMSAAKSSADVSTQLAKNLESEKSLYAALQESLTKVKTDLDSAIGLKAKADSERDSVRLDLEKAQQELHVLRVAQSELSGKYDSLQIVANRAKELLGPNFPLASAVAPQIDGMVKAVDAKEKLVVLSVGKDQKVQIGYEFTVYRGGEFIGKVKVIKVFPDLCGAEVVFTKDGTEIQSGDKASTQI